MDAPKGFVSIEQAVVLLDMSRRTIYNMIENKEIKTKKIRKWRFVPTTEIERIKDGR